MYLSSSHFRAFYVFFSEQAEFLVKWLFRQTARSVQGKSLPHLIVFVCVRNLFWPRFVT